MPALQSTGVPAKRSTTGDGPPALAYLVSSYPTLSMAWLLREVLQLRRMGVRLDVAAVNAPDRPAEKMTAEEAAEAGAAYHLKTHGAAGGIKAHLLGLVRHPGGYLRGWQLVFELGGLDIRSVAFNLMYFTEALMVGAWMERKQQRHLHVHLASQAATVGMYVRRAFGFGLSITVHGPDEFYDTGGQYLAQKIAAANFICCISYYARSQLMRLSPASEWDKLVVSRLGVDAEVFAPRPSRHAPETFEIVCVGRLTPAKGQHLLIEAVERLTQQGRSVRLRLVGDGPDGAALRERTALLANPEAVVFEGAVNQDRIRALYAMADAFCIPSFAEGIPVVLMEAMAMEIACVSTHITGIPELIRDGVDGLLVAPSDVDGLTDALARLIDDAELRERLGKSGRQRVREHYDLNRSVEMLAGIFAERVHAATDS
jgi:colanic acid/amylovoran biosynthesis glycosyltransferase